MGDHRAARHVVVLSSTWGDGSDRAFAVRGLAGAMSRVTTIDVLVPGTTEPARADGLFDLIPLGRPTGGRWPGPEEASWPDGLSADLVLLDQTDDQAVALAGRYLTGCPVVAIGQPGPSLDDQGIDALVVVGPPPPAMSDGATTSAPVHRVGLHVPINPLAARRRHNGFGFTNYVLVLSDRSPTDVDADPGPPPAAVAWLTAGLPDRDLVVVEDGVASAWRSRSLRGRVAIDTRTDLWRLVAHALVTVDLAPGSLLARECVESLRYGTPVVVPAGTAAAELAGSGGGLWYSGPAELLACVEALDDRQLRDELGGQGRELADTWYGDPTAFVDRVGAMLDAVLEGRPQR
ncbi:MAG TPA: hypothetical protein VHW47_06385 [Acidimicrobiales bacterium]|jgi:hypothetical protein|nr:hypothetical protein [Acidimicrobiales bacterium]